MLKLVVCWIALGALASAAPAATGDEPAGAAAAADNEDGALPVLKTLAVQHETGLAKVGEVVESVPTAVSHQSTTIVHSRAEKTVPLLAPALISSNYAGRIATTPILYEQPQYPTWQYTRAGLPIAYEHPYAAGGWYTIVLPASGVPNGAIASDAFSARTEPGAVFVVPDWRKGTKRVK